MSIAPISHAPVSHLTTASAVERTVEAAPATQPERRLRAVPTGTEARGFVLYVGLDELKAADAGTDLSEVVAQLRALTAKLVPTSETYAAVALAPIGAGGRDVDVVRLALQDPAALAKHRDAEPAPSAKRRTGIVVDLSRKRVELDGEVAPLTYKEFELLQYLVLREGRTIDRSELIASLWSVGEDDAPNERTIDVHVRRLRAKLGDHHGVIETVLGAGYKLTAPAAPADA